MTTKICVDCKKEYPISEFKHGRKSGKNGSAKCIHCLNRQRNLWRIKTNKEGDRKYNKTPKGYLVRTYRNMKSRVSGVYKRSMWIYYGKEILDKNVFYDWSLNDKEFNRLYEEWVKCNYDTKLSPSVDRIDPDGGYTLENIRWLTQSENSKKQRKENHKRVGCYSNDPLDICNHCTCWKKTYKK